MQNQTNTELLAEMENHKKVVPKTFTVKKKT
jgi:hypothetical protein